MPPVKSDRIPMPDDVLMPAQAGERQESLVSKLAAVMAATQRIKKRGRNDFHKYDYATEADIADAIRNELATRHVMLIPEIVSEERIEIGKTGSGSVKVLTTLVVNFTFFDGESGETIARLWRGWGIDSEDKGGYKATTGAEKYFLLKTFLIPTGDDPERDDKQSKRSQDRATAKPDKEIKQARKAVGPLPKGVVYINKVIPKSNGDREWVVIVTSDGEELIAREPGCMSLATNLAQEAAPCEIVTSRNSKGNLEIDEISRWRPAGAVAVSAPAREPGEDDVPPPGDDDLGVGF